MVPTLNGRIQTRVFLLLVIGIPWTLVITPFLPRKPGGSLGGLYETTFFVLGTVLLVGVFLWEPLYHGLMQFRWEKDWPICFSLLVAIPEGLLAYAIVRAIGPKPTPPAAGPLAFVIHFSTLWLLVWLAAIGPMRVPFPRWRFRGGRLL
ncbi:MAG: hypothetical protein M3N98_13230 [Actinomycetota bacterium]|nr:hypothetical protein [Actinomycetota bacterium]